MGYGGGDIGGREGDTGEQGREYGEGDEGKEGKGGGRIETTALTSSYSECFPADYERARGRKRERERNKRGERINKYPSLSKCNVEFVFFRGFNFLSWMKFQKNS